MADFIKNEAGVNVYLPGQTQTASNWGERPQPLTAAARRGIYFEALGAGLFIAAAIGASNTVLADEGPSPFAQEPDKIHQVLVPPENPPLVDTIANYPHNLQQLFPGLGVYDQQKVLEAAVVAAEDFQLTKTDEERLISLYPKVAEYAEKYGIPERLMIGQIATESRGDPKAVSETAGAEGVAQIMPWLSKERGIDPYDIDASLDLMGQILRDEYERFGDWSLAVWSWHIGDGEVYRAIQAYERANFTECKLKDVIVPHHVDPAGRDEAVNESLQRRTEYKRFIKDYQINTFKLFEVEEIKTHYSGVGFDGTLDYVSRIAGLSIKLEDLISGRVEVAKEHQVE